MYFWHLLWDIRCALARITQAQQQNPTTGLGSNLLYKVAWMNSDT